MSTDILQILMKIDTNIKKIENNDVDVMNCKNQILKRIKRLKLYKPKTTAIPM